MSLLRPTIIGVESSGKAGERHQILRDSARRIEAMSEHWVWYIRDLRWVGGHRMVVSRSSAFVEDPLPPPWAFLRRAVDEKTSNIMGERGM